MVTQVISGGQQVLTLTNGAVTLFDAATNDPFFLCDYIPNVAPTTARAYPLRIDAAGADAVWDGGRFYGNILESAARRTVYNSTNDDFNSALMFIRNGTNLTIRNGVWGISGAKSTGFIDGIRASQAGNVIIEDCEIRYARDDAIEADGGGNLTLRRVFGEGLYVWISATGAQASKIIRADDCLIRIDKWRELEIGQTVSGREEFQIGPVFKTNASSTSPQWQFTNVTLATPRRWPENNYGRTLAALNRMSCTNCTWLSYEGQLDTTSGLRNAVIAAGWNLIEGTAAETEWQTQRAAWFNDTTPPIAISTLTSPCTFDVFAGSSSLTPPVLLGTEISATNSAVASFVATNPAYSVGDLVLVFVMNDGGTDRVGTPSVTAPNSEVVTTEQAIVSDGTSGADGHSIACFSYVATSAESSGANITCAISGGLSAVEQFTVVVMVFDAGTFNPTTRLVNKSHTFSTGGETSMSSAAFSAATAEGRVVFVGARAFDAVDTTPSGWTQRANTDPGALPGYAATRDALTTSAESVAAATFSDSALDSRAYTALTVVVSPAV